MVVPRRTVLELFFIRLPTVSESAFKYVSYSFQQFIGTRTSADELYFAVPACTQAQD
jgi:hypothetical protein